MIDSFFFNLKHLSNLNSLSIHYPEDMPVSIQDHSSECNYFSSLKCLKLEGGKDIPFFLNSMMSVKWSNLEILSLSSDANKAFNKLSNCFSSISQLKSLSIENVSKTNEIINFDIIEELSKLINLEKLDLSGVDIEEEYLINSFQYFNKMKRLKLKCINPSNCDLFIQNMSNLRSLKELSVEYIPERIYMNNCFLQALPNLQYFLIDCVDQMKCIFFLYIFNRLIRDERISRVYIFS